MKFLADLHLHSSHSRATSRDMTLESIWRWAQLKGIAVVATGDLTHPAWGRELSEKLEPLGNGLFALREEFCTGDVPVSCRAEVSFILSGEISCIYRKNGRTRKVHLLVLLPDLGAVGRLNGRLAAIGNLRSDGRPILGLDAKVLLQLALDASPEAMVIPAHAWTPHFSVFGAASGFDTLEECFEELAPQIFAIETGLSSDPAMNRRISKLDRVGLISCSDAHSPAKIGREATIFDTEPAYGALREALRTGRGLAGTIEFFPEEGKYHHDGHRPCKVSLAPSEAKRHGLRCPVCGGKLTIGVLHRIEELADRSQPEGPGRFVSAIPLAEVLAQLLGAGANTKKVTNRYHAMLERLGPELRLLTEVATEEITAAGDPALAGAIACMRAGKISVSPGYDGEYGKITIDCGGIGMERRSGPQGNTWGSGGGSTSS